VLVSNSISGFALVHRASAAWHCLYAGAAWHSFLGATWHFLNAGAVWHCVLVQRGTLCVLVQRGSDYNGTTSACNAQFLGLHHTDAQTRMYLLYTIKCTQPSLLVCNAVHARTCAGHGSAAVMSIGPHGSAPRPRHTAALATNPRQGTGGCCGVFLFS
jgi:hypothetical protein